MTRDPVCGMQVDEKSAAARVEHDGITYLFCCEGCRQRFEEDPDRFVERSRSDWGRP